MNDMPENSSDREWLTVRTVFEKARSWPPDKRSIMLMEICNGDAGLLEEVLSLLNASDTEEALSNSIGEIALPDTECPVHRTIGPYSLDRLLGRGGMGTVYLAHRADGHFHRNVAIKFMDFPIASEIFRRQFRLERQILAGLSHPFIARLFDGGVSDDGELYLVMEYVDGIPVLDYCRQHRLSTRSRLQLFKSICVAVQYAHQNLVIHRDLKPANILVDSDGMPHLLDFGTAKLLSPAEEDIASDLTLHGLRSLTPQYASPEQIRGCNVTTASDIYSLGVILFELVTDVLPYTLRQKNTEAMQRLICETEPPKPSAVALSTAKLDADLDSIVLMALRKEPNQRYLTVQQLTADIDAWLEGQPVAARRGTVRYRARKFAMRNKLALGAGTLLLIAVVFGVAGVIWQARTANLQRDRAEANARAMRDLSNSLLSEIDQAVKQLPNSTSVRRLIVQRVVEHLDSVPRNDKGDRLTRMYLANAYIQLARLEGSPAEQSIGDETGALESVEKALAVAQALEADYPSDDDVKDTLVRILKTKSLLLYGLANPEAAISTLTPAIQILDQKGNLATATPSQIADAADASRLLGAELGDPETPNAGDYSAALIAYKKSTELYMRSLAIDSGFVRARRGIARNSEAMGHIQIFTDPSVAVDEISQAMALWDALPLSVNSDAESRLEIQYAKTLLGKALSHTRDYDRALPVFEEARKSMEQAVAWDSTDSRALTFLVGTLGDEAEADIDSVNPILNPSGFSTTTRNTRIGQAKALVRRCVELTRRLTLLDQNNSMNSAYLAYERVLLGTIADDNEIAAAGVAELRRLASRSDASSEVLSRAASIMTSILPARLRDRKVAVEYAERLAALNHRHDPNSLLILTLAYLDDQQFDRARQTAREGLSLLAPPRPGALSERSRVLLERALMVISHSQYSSNVEVARTSETSSARAH